MKSIGCFLVVLLFSAVPAFAGDVTLFIADQNPGSMSLSSGSGAALQSLTSPASFGAIGFRSGSGAVFGPEHSVVFAPNFLDSNSKALMLSSNFVVQAPVRGFKPYATVGMGTVWAWGSGPSDIGAKFAFNYGGGIKIQPAGPIGIRLDARGYSITGVQSQTLKVLEASVGLVFGF